MTATSNLRSAVSEVTQGITHHGKDVCDGPPCPFHSPSEHHMVDWPMNWRHDRNLLERLCEHGVGHPDPDSVDWLAKRGASGGVHGCDGCCTAPEPHVPTDAEIATAISELQQITRK